MKPFDYVNSINHNKENLMVDTDNDVLAESGYVQMPNDTSSATKGYITNPVGGSEAPTTSLAQSNLFNTSYSLVDGKHATAFAGELA